VLVVKDGGNVCTVVPDVRPWPRERFASAADERGFFVSGGLGEERVLNDLWNFDFARRARQKMKRENRPGLARGDGDGDR
jgi:hypothetical protein